jgi:hypothetical protein
MIQGQTGTVAVDLDRHFPKWDALPHIVKTDYNVHVYCYDGLELPTRITNKVNST